MARDAAQVTRHTALGEGRIRNDFCHTEGLFVAIRLGDGQPCLNNGSGLRIVEAIEEVNIHGISIVPAVRSRVKALAGRLPINHHPLRRRAAKA